MERPYENEASSYNHKADAGVAAGRNGSRSAEIATPASANNHLEIEEENQMAVAYGMERIWEIEEVVEIEEVEGAASDRAPQSISKRPSGRDGDDVYVAVGRSESSSDALSWALKNAVRPGSFVYLIHVFPEVQQIPTPLGNMPKDKVSKDQAENYMNQERDKRRGMLHKYINLCRQSKVEYDVHLIESNQTENAILELIPVLNIKLLVLGTSKSNLRRLKRGGTKAGIIQKNAPHYCEVKIVCEGKDISTITAASDQTPPASSLASENTTTKTRELSPKSSLSPEIRTISRNGSRNRRKKSKFTKLFRYFSCKKFSDIQ